MRTRNDDRALVAHVRTRTLRDLLVLAVADGVGSSERGNEAAEMALSSIVGFVYESSGRDELGQVASNAVSHADRTICARLGGRGTTTASLVVIDERGPYHAVNVGDSRIFTWNPIRGTVEQISEDDTIEKELKKHDVNAEGMLRARGLTGSLSKALGDTSRDPASLEPDHLPEVPRGSGIVLATDGNWVRGGQQFVDLITHAKNARQLTERALLSTEWSGGADNASIVSVEDGSRLIRSLVSSRPRGSGPMIRVWTPDCRILLSESAPGPDRPPSRRSAPASPKLVPPAERRPRRPQAEKDKNSAPADATPRFALPEFRDDASDVGDVNDSQSEAGPA